MKINKATRKVLSMVLAIIMAFTIAPFSVSATQVPLAQVTTQSGQLTQQPEQIAATAGGTLVGRQIEFNWGTDERWPHSRWTLNIPSVGPVTVGSFRYDATLDGAIYEAWCIDPHLNGPEQTTLNYSILGALPPAVAAAARIAYPNNARITDSSYPHHYNSAFISYMTRLAITVAARPGTTIVGDDVMHQLVYDIARGEGTWHNPAHFVPSRYVHVNGVENAVEEGTVDGGMILSAPFNLTNSHNNNPVMFRWQAGTPAGTQLIINNAVVATAPALPANNSFDGSVSFRLAVPQGANVDSARVEIVGIHDDYADQAWYARTQVNPDGWQVMAFYIPRIRATAGFTYEPIDIPPNGSTPPPDNAVRIQKICAITRNNIPGALIRLRGMSSHQVVTGDGQLWEIDNTGINVSQVLTAGATTAVPGDVTSTVTDGVWTLEGLPWGFYMVEEERAPDGFSMYPQHTAYGFWHLPPNVVIDSPDGLTYDLVERGPNDNHILITFENYPFSEIVIYKREVSNGVGNNQLLADATFRIQGYYPGNPAIPIDRVATTDASGRVVFSDLPAGHFTVTEIQPPTGYLLGENNVWTVDIGWGQTVAAGTANSHTFFNIPKSSLEILKVDGVTNEPLSGAIFELSDPTTGETWQATSGANGIAIFGIGDYGNILYPDRTYILREIVAPSGFVLLPEPKEVVLSPGNENRVTIENWRNPGLRIIKQCQDTGTRLAGAHFTIEAQGSGSPLPTDFPLVTNEIGEILVPWTLFEGESERTFIITEIVPPPGFHLSDPNWQSVTLLAGHDNTVVFSNRRMPTLTISKTDSVTDSPIQGTEFTIERLSPAPTGMITGNPFHTDVQGNIVIENLPAGVYRVIETRAAANYWLDPQAANRTWTITMREDEDYLLQVENTLLPTLVITKMNALTNMPIPLTHFRVEFEVPNSSSVQLVGNFVTDSNGQIVLPYVQSGWYRITETRPAPGMALSTNNNYRVFLNPGDNTYNLLDFINSQGSDTPSQSEPQLPDDPTSDSDNAPPVPDSSNNTNEEEVIGNLTGNMQVTDGDAHLSGENIWNWPLNSIVIKKSDATTGQLLQGATFELIHVSSGESGTRGTVIGRFTTNHSGIIVITGLEPGTYVVEEVVPPPNYTLSVNNSQHVNLRPDGFSIVEVEFSNHPFGGLLITKKCESTGRPLQNAEFRVTNSDGAVVGTANGLFRTNQQGEIFIPNLSPGSYIISEYQHRSVLN